MTPQATRRRGDGLTICSPPRRRTASDHWTRCSGRGKHGRFRTTRVAAGRQRIRALAGVVASCWSAAARREVLQHASIRLRPAGAPAPAPGFITFTLDRISGTPTTARDRSPATPLAKSRIRRRSPDSARLQGASGVVTSTRTADSGFRRRRSRSSSTSAASASGASTAGCAPSSRFVRTSACRFCRRTKTKANCSSASRRVDGRRQREPAFQGRRRQRRSRRRPAARSALVGALRQLLEAARGRRRSARRDATTCLPPASSPRPLPSEATTQNTFLPAGLLWLKASVRRAWPACARC